MSSQTQEKRAVLNELVHKSLILTYGKWGAVYREYLLKNNSQKYYLLLSQKELYEHISEIDIRLDNKYRELVSAISEDRGVTGELKRKNPKLWKRKMKLIEEEAEETIKSEIKYTINTIE